MLSAQLPHVASGCQIGTAHVLGAKTSLRSSSFKADFPYLFSRTVARMSSMSRENDLLNPFMSPCNISGDRFHQGSSTLCLRRSRIFREVRDSKLALLFPVDSGRTEKEGTRTVETAASSLIVISIRVPRNIEGLRGVLGIEERMLTHWLFSSVLRH